MAKLAPANVKDSANSKPRYEIIEVKSDLSKKTRMVASMEAIEKDLVAKAESVMADLSSQFAGWIDSDVQRLLTAKDAVLEYGLNAETKHELFISSHEIKGLAATFGFPLIGKLAYSLCNMLETIQDNTKIPVSVIEQHTASIAAMVHKNAQGDGSAIARTLTMRLCKVTEDYVVHVQNK